MKHLIRVRRDLLLTTWLHLPCLAFWTYPPTPLFTLDCFCCLPFRVLPCRAEQNRAQVRARLRRVLLPAVEAGHPGAPAGVPGGQRGQGVRARRHEGAQGERILLSALEVQVDVSLFRQAGAL